jgi:hypothetical protein
MAYTTHGHHINGTSKENEPENKARCGGPNMCAKCSRESMSKHTTGGIYEAEILIGDNPANYQEQAMQMVQTYITGLWLLEGKAPASFHTYMAWFSKTLGNWKALVGTSLNDGFYYEVTHNGEKKETYLDAYMKFDNVVIPD